MAIRILSSFTTKLIVALALVAFGDWLGWQGPHTLPLLGSFALAWAAATLVVTPKAWARWTSAIAGLCALLFAAILADNPSLLALLLFAAALGLAVLLPRYEGFDSAVAWAGRLFAQGLVSLIGPWRDLFQLRGKVSGEGQWRRVFALLWLPVGGSLLFLTLFAVANPVIGDILLPIVRPRIDATTVIHIIFWGVLFTAVWATIRPQLFAYPALGAAEPFEPGLPEVPTAPVLLALIAFNALFALQNALDLAFLWSGAPLPGKLTLAGYAHQGAYPLIATALIAGLFVLVALRPGSKTANVPAIRLLVVFWIAQNIFLVASTTLRMIDYIESYSLTALRIAALLWMGLVAVGLVLIVWRMLRGHSTTWLVNANVLAAAVVLAGSSAVDFNATAAAWNVRHAREVGGKGVELDLCYLNEMGPSALVSLIELERRPGLSPAFAERLAWVRHKVLARTLEARAAGDRTWRNERRIGQMFAMLGGEKLSAPPAAGPTGRACDGSILPRAVASAAENPYGLGSALTDGSER